MFDKLEKRLIIKGTIETITPLHIGSGKPEVELGGHEMPIVKLGDQPYIPGSSLKGKTRAEAEKILRKENIDVCYPPDVRNMCGTTKSNPEQFCLCCKIFGTAGKRVSVASKTRFRDAYPTKKLETMSRVGIAIDRDTGTVSERALYTIEAVPPGTLFNFEIVGENLTDEELKLLFSALKSVEHSGLGGSSSRGFGKVKISFDSIVERTAKYYLGKEAEKEWSGDSLNQWLAEKGCI